MMNNNQTTLSLSNDNFQRVLAGKKLTTIRLGRKEITPGLALIVNQDTQATLTINIWYVNPVLLSDLELNDARLDGFDTLEDLLANLRSCYQRPIFDYEHATQVHFDVVAAEEVA
ncbi:ASCH domain-containing protein [Vibrio xiamenensis]|uniref:ASCH domain-containing protein n=2 Tax=Vibrio xiamenensis TaxID=861298 RepID=A0A1G8HPU1_9VIBR|nr:ASCH domain-containing protein [Vibrio xiamenensis]